MGNELAFLKSIIYSNFARLGFPLKISYAVTYRCNLQCKICNIWKKPLVQDELTPGEIDAFFEKANKFFWVNLTGGEVFLRPDLHEIVGSILTHCRDLHSLHVATNGQLKDKAVDLVKFTRQKNSALKIVFTVSIDGPLPLHDALRGRDGAWERAMGTFLALASMDNVKPQIGFTLSEHNASSFPDTFAAIKQRYPPLRFDDININIFQKSAIYYENQDMPDCDYGELVNRTRQILEMDKDAFSVNNFLRRSYLRLFPRYIRRKKYPIKCQALSSTCFLDPYGNLYPCLAFNKKLANIKQMRASLATLWNSQEAREIAKECSHNICPSCWSPCDAYSAIGGSLAQSLCVL